MFDSGRSTSSTKSTITRVTKSSTKISPSAAISSLSLSKASSPLSLSSLSKRDFINNNNNKLMFSPMRTLTRTVTVVAFVLLLNSAILLENVTCMSLDRLGIDRNELLNEQPDGAINTDIVVDDMELKAVPLSGGGATDAYMLLPAGVAAEIGGAEQQAAVNKNEFNNVVANVEAGADEKSVEEAAAQNNAIETSSDMLMMETNESPVVQMVELPAELVQKPEEEEETHKLDMLPADEEESKEIEVGVEAGAETEVEAEKNDIPEMLPVPQALESASLTAAEANESENVAVEMSAVSPPVEDELQASVQLNENSAEMLPVPQALVGSASATAPLDEVPEVNEVEQSNDEKADKEETLLEQPNDEKAVVLPEQLEDEGTSVEEQKIDEEPEKIAVELSENVAEPVDETVHEFVAETAAEPVAEEAVKVSAETAPEPAAETAPEPIADAADEIAAEPAVENNDEADAQAVESSEAASVENEIVEDAKLDVAQTEDVKTETETESESQSVFGDFADAVEAVEEEIIGAADPSEKLEMPAEAIEVKEPEVLHSEEKVEKEEEEEKPEQSEEEKLEQSAEKEVFNSEVAPVVENVDVTQPQLPSDSGDIMSESKPALETETEVEQNEILPEQSDVIKPETVPESISESENTEPLADSVAEANEVKEEVQEPEKTELVSEFVETIKDEKPEEEAIVSEAASSEPIEKADSIESIKQDIDEEKQELPNKTENKEEVKPVDEIKNDEVITEDENKDENKEEELHDSVEELVAEIPASGEESDAVEKQESPAAESAVIVPMEENSPAQEDEISTDERKEEVVDENLTDEVPFIQPVQADQQAESAVKDEDKETLVVDEESKPEEENSETIDANKEQEAEPEIIEQTDASEEKDESPPKQEEEEVQNLVENEPPTPEKSEEDDVKEETLSEIAQKIDTTVQAEEETPQIVEIASEEVDTAEKQTPVEEEKQEIQESLNEEEPQQTEIKQESIILADVPEKETAAETETDKDSMEAISEENNEEIAAPLKESETEPLAESISAETQPQETPAAEPMQDNIAPSEETTSILTTIIQTPQPQQEDADTKEPTSNVDNVVEPAAVAAADAASVETEAEAAEAPIMPVVVINEENVAPPQAAQPAQPIESVEVPQAPVISTQPAQAPLNVVDSVLNYVNASFLNLQQNKPQDEMQQQPLQQQQQKLQPLVQPEESFNSQLRRYDGAQVWRIVVQNDKDRRMADELQTKYGGQLWKEVKQEVDYLLKPQVLSDAARHIRAANLSRIVLIDNLQKVIEVENPPEDEILLLQNRKGHRLTWQAYHRVEDIHGFLDYMAKTYPDICSVETIGYSIEKRPLKILKISNGNPTNPGIWIDGGMHAREWIGPASVTYIVNQLVEGWDDLPAYMKNINWYIHPVANPDGYEYSHTTDRLWRKNMRQHGRQCPGVDLNRNFGYKWGGKGTSANPCSQTYRGSKAFSEPETFYISKFISNAPRNTFQAYLTFHSYGQYILYPWGYDYAVTTDRADLDRVARQAGTTITKSSGGKYTVGPAAQTLYPAAGGADDWAKGIAGIKYTYTVEMGDTGRYGFVLPASYIEQNGKDGLTFVETVARAITLGRSTERRRRF